MENLRLNALALHLGVEVEDLEICSYNDQIVEYGSQEYLVVTDDEADELWDEDLENYIEECILSELPEQYRNYFDNEAWKSDARNDGRAHSLNKYDGTYDEITVYEWENHHDDIYTDTDSTPEGFWSTGEKETFYIYRQN